MISHYYKPLKKRRFTESVNDMRAVIPNTPVDTDFRGFITTMSGTERLNNSQLGVNASLMLYTGESDIILTDRIIDGSSIYEVVWLYKDMIQKYYRYALNQVESAV